MSEIGKQNIAKVEYPSFGGNRPFCCMDFTIHMADGTQIGDELLRIESFEARESISQLFEYQIQLKANDALPGGGDWQLDFSKVMGQSATVRIGLPKPGPTKVFPEKWSLADWSFSCFNGIIAQFTLSSPGTYSAVLRPALWKLTLSNDYRVYPENNIRDTLLSILQARGIQARVEASEELNPALHRIQNWLQTGETDFDFINRLLEKASLYYYFEHSEKEHVLVISNENRYPKIYRDDRPLRYTYSDEQEAGLQQDDLILDYSFQQQMINSGVKATIVRYEAAWEEDQIAHFQTYRGESRGNDDFPVHHYRIYPYGGSEREADYERQLTSQKMSTSSITLNGSSTCRLLKPGFQFKTTHAPNAWVRPSLEKKTFVVIQVEHSCTDEGQYLNRFTATEASGLVTPFNIQNTHQGSIIAKVSPPPPEPKDWRYYEKNHFGWLPHVYQDAPSPDPKVHTKGVWVTFSTSEEQGPPVWVRLAPQMQTVPEVGVTVVITRSSDDAEVPEIQNIIQSNGSKVVMPSGWTANTQVGSNYSTHYGDGKSVRFGRDSKADLEAAKKIVEERYAEGVYRETAFSQGGSYNYAVSENGRDGLLSRSESFGNNYSEHHGNHESIGVGKNQSISVRQEGDEKKVPGEIQAKYGSGKYKDVSYSKGDSYSHNIGDHESIGVGKSRSVNVVDGADVSAGKGVVDSKTSFKDASYTKGDAFSEYHGNTENYHYGDTYSEQQGDARSKNTGSLHHNVTTVGISSSQSAIGLSNNNSAVGLNNSQVATGLENAQSVTGIHNLNTVTGVSANLSVVGSANKIDVIGYSTDITVMGGGMKAFFGNEPIDLSMKPVNTKLDMNSMDVEMKTMKVII